jgi:hypothetical protein
MSAAGMLRRRVLVLLGKTIGTLAIVAVLATSCKPAQGNPPDGGYAAPTETVGLAAAKPCHARHVDETDPQAWLPDPHCTPGAINPAVTVGQLCPVANTRQWRTDTSALKKDQLAHQYDYVDSTGPHTVIAADSEEDHLISLELGGSPTAKTNLWPQPRRSPNEKDKVEGAAHAAGTAGNRGELDRVRQAPKREVLATVGSL